MSTSSILLISSDEAAATTVGNALAGIEGARVNLQDMSVGQMNGAAVDMAAGHDIVVFTTDPSNAADLSAIEVLADHSRDDTVFLALTDADLPLSKARALTRAGVDDVLPYPSSGNEIAEQVAEWIAKKRAALEERYASVSTKGKLIAVQQARGGIGATTIAVNLADQLLDRRGTFKKEAANRVVIVDLSLIHI